MKKPITDLDKYDEDETDIDLQNRGILTTASGGVRMIFYAWLSEKRKEQNRQPWTSKYCPFSEGEKVSKTCSGVKLVGKIKSIDRDYYDGDCPVLYVDLDKRSARKWIDYRAARKAAQAETPKA